MRKTSFTANQIIRFIPKAFWVSALLGVLLFALYGAADAETTTRFPRHLYKADLSKGNNSLIMLAYRSDKAPQRPYNNLSEDDKRKLKEKYKKWNALPPSEKKKLRNRMNQWRNLPPQDQKKYRNRFKQWQQLTPEERKAYQERLNNWESLTPEEKEMLRRKFRK